MEQFFRGGTKVSEKVVPDTKIFSKNFVPPEQILPEQNSSDRSMGKTGRYTDFFPEIPGTFVFTLSVLLVPDVLTF